MRFAAVIFGLILAWAMPARAELCANCAGRSYTKDIGHCGQCEQGRTMSGQFKLCLACSDRLGLCHHCLMPTKAVAATQPATSQPNNSDLRLWVRVVQVDAPRSANRAPLEDWIAAELKKLNVSGGVGGDWQELGETFYVIEDSRHLGQLKVRVGQAGDSESLQVDFGGTGSDVRLPRKAGATLLVRTPLKSSVAGMDLYLAFKVAAKPDDITKPGVYRAGPWEYSLVVTAPGTKSEGMVGKLNYDGKPVPDAEQGDYYQTPWGDVMWRGNPITMWGPHGWMLRKPGATGGRLLPEPAKP